MTISYSRFKIFILALLIFSSYNKLYAQQNQLDSVQIIIETQRFEVGLNFFFVYGGLNISTNYYDAYFDLSISPGRKFNNPVVYNNFAFNTKISFPIMRLWDENYSVDVCYIGVSYAYINEKPSEVGLSGSGHASSFNYIFGFRNITGINRFFDFLKNYTFYCELGYSSQDISNSVFAKSYLKNPYFDKLYISAGLSYKIF